MTPDFFDLIFHGGTVVSGAGRGRADVGLLGGKIAAVGDLHTAGADEAVDVTGLHILPGVIDTQVHFREPGLTHKEDIESGTRAAVMGGVTTVFEMPNTDPTTTSRAALEDKLARAEGRAWCHYAFFVGASTENLDDLADLETRPGTPGVGEVFMGSSTGPLLVTSTDDLRRVLQNGRRPCVVHAEEEARLIQRTADWRAGKLTLDGEGPFLHPQLRDAESARLATARILALSRETGRPVHILHVSTSDELPLIAEAKRAGLGTTCEVTPQHLTFSSEDYDRLGTHLQMNPPVRSADHRAALWAAVREGLFDLFGSDHAPHTREEKARPYPDSPSGLPGVQTMLPVVLDFVHRGELPLEQAVRMLSERPSEIFGVREKGRLAPGYDADLAVVDLGAEFEVTAEWLQSRCGWSPWLGARLTGRPVHTLIDGRFAVRDGALAHRPAGRMVAFEWK